MMLQGVTWYHHASCSIMPDNFAIYIDPWEMPKTLPPANLILVTHAHYDHYSPPDIQQLSKPDTVLVVPHSLLGQVPGTARFIKPGESITVGPVKITGVPAYNLAKIFHPKTNQWLGYVVETSRVRYYHAGDTDYIPEMETIRADVVFLPIGGTYTMDPPTAAKAARAVQAQIVVPIHWGKVVGTDADARQFATLLPDKVRILEQGKRY